MLKLRDGVAIACALAGCSSGSAPDILGLTDTVAIVGQELILEIEGVDPDGDSLAYSVEADIKLDGAASVAQTPSGNGVFRWTPMAADAGSHVFDFNVSDGDHSTTVSIEIDVRESAAGIPVFEQPEGSGEVVDLAMDPCATFDILIADTDSTQVAITEEEPLIEGATLTTQSGLTAQWRWCPTAAQVAASNRYTLFLSANDGSNPKTVKEFVIVLGGATSGPTLIINEVDYDNISTDSAEFVELYNASGMILPLAGLKVVLVNGATNASYQTIDLGAAGQLAIGQYLIIAGSGVTVQNSAKKVNPLWTQDQVQNGAPDGIAIIDDVRHVIIDALSYEGDVTAAMLPGFTAPVSLVEGTPLAATVADSNTATISLCRIPSGKDSDQAAIDWRTCSALSVGKSNTP